MLKTTWPHGVVSTDHSLWPSTVGSVRSRAGTERQGACTGPCSATNARLPCVMLPRSRSWTRSGTGTGGCRTPGRVPPREETARSCGNRREWARGMRRSVRAAVPSWNATGIQRRPPSLASYRRLKAARARRTRNRGSGRVVGHSVVERTTPLAPNAQQDEEGPARHPRSSRPCASQGPQYGARSPLWEKFIEFRRISRALSRGVAARARASPAAYHHQSCPKSVPICVSWLAIGIGLYRNVHALTRYMSKRTDA